MVEKNSIDFSMPIGVKIISIFYYIGAVFGVISGIMFFIGAEKIISFLNKIPILSLLGAVGAGLFIFIGIVCLIFALLGFLIGRGLWKGKNWARIIVIVFSSIIFVLGLFSLISPNFEIIIGLVINGFIAGYLIFSKEVKRAFARS